MGRTNPTFRDLLSALERRWGDFRRALRRRDQPRFDRLFEYARAHADAAASLNHAEPLYPALLAMLLEQERRLDEQADRIKRLELRPNAPTGAEGREGVAVGDADDGDDDAV